MRGNKKSHHTQRLLEVVTSPEAVVLIGVEKPPFKSLPAVRMPPAATR